MFSINCGLLVTNYISVKGFNGKFIPSGIEKCGMDENNMIE